MSRSIPFLILIIIILSFFGCQRGKDPSAPTNSDGSSVLFYFAKPSNLDALVVFAKAMVSAPDMDTILVDLMVNPNSVEGTI